MNMDRKINVGVIGATGMVGQNFLRLLDGHPWFEVTYLAASPNSAGKTYAEAVAGRWRQTTGIPAWSRDLVVHDAAAVDEAAGKCRVVFSAVQMDKQGILKTEEAYAGRGFAVVSNNSAHRTTPDVPMMAPEINHGHLAIIPQQRKQRGWDKGCLVVKPNCSIQSYMLPLHALLKAGYVVDRIIVTTLQAVSGAGYPGVPSLDVIDNVVPFIGGEEEKSETEPLKIFGTVEGGKIVPAAGPCISAHCTRVPVSDGHTACVSLGFAGKKPSPEEIIKLWREYSSVPQEMELPSAPPAPIVYRDEPDRPQPRTDRHAANGMAVTVGRLRPCNVLDYRFVGLHHNTVRGAAGGGILTAELLAARGYLDQTT
jgi:aspartate-semialdehyde dehydrogenase